MNCRKLSTLLVASLLLACNQHPDQQLESDLAALHGDLADIQDLLSSGLPITTINERYLEFFVDDLVLLPPGRQAIQGRDAALTFYNNVWGGVTELTLEYQKPEIIIDGDLAVRRYVGRAEFRPNAESEPVTGSGRYIDVLRRQGNGDWRIVWHAWTRIVP